MKVFLKRSLCWIQRLGAGLTGYLFDRKYLGPNVPMSKLVSHSNYMQYLSNEGNHENLRILEIGSREVTGASSARSLFPSANYVGFDYYPDPNVDVVGDAHRLSEYLGEDRFDIIYSSAVFEHLAMPWVVATEISKLLKVGCLVFVETHMSFSSHERPWHFFQFGDMALRVLFSPALGFECIEAGVSNPMVGRFSIYADRYLRLKPIGGLYCHSEFLGRKIKEAGQFDRSSVDLRNVVGKTTYPAP